MNSAPVCVSIDPEVLREAAVGILRDGEIDERAKRCRGIAGSQQRRCAVDHVAGPHQVIAALIVVAFGLPPRNGERCNERARERFVLVRQQQTVAAVIEIALIERCAFKRPQMRGSLIPLLLVFRQVLVKRDPERLQQIGNCSVLAVSESKTERELLRLAKVQLAGQGNVSVAGPLKLPIHLEVIVEVGPAIARANVAAGEMRKGDGRSHRHPLIAFLRHQDSQAVGEADVAIVAGAADFEMRGAKSKYLEAGEKGALFGGDSRAHKKARQMRVADHLLDDGIASIRVGIGATIAERMV